jgi:hypothetical protein
MLKKYKKKDAPSWQRKLLVVVASFFAATLLLFIAWAVVLVIDWARVDDCLDQGGSYNYETGECDFQSNHYGPED